MLNKIKNFCSRNRRKIVDIVSAVGLGLGLTFVGYSVGYNQGSTDMLIDIVKKNEVIHF